MFSGHSNSSQKRLNMSHETARVKNFMQSVDPSLVGRNDNHCIPSSPHDSTPRKMTFPFFPDSSTFAMEPPMRTPPSLPRRKKKQQHSLTSSPLSSISTTSSLISSPTPSSAMFYSSNFSRIKTNPIKVVPYPRKTLFLSPNRAMADSSYDSRFATPTSSIRQKNREEPSLLSQLPRKTCMNMVPFQQNMFSNVIASANTDNTIGITNTAIQYGNQGVTRDGLSEGNHPFIQRKSPPFLFQAPRTPESAMKKGTRSPQVISTPKIGPFSPTAGNRTPVAIVTNPWHTTGMISTPRISTPKRVSLDTGNESPPTLPKETNGASTIFAPILRPEPSAGTAMAASALMSMMVMPAPSKRTLVLAGQLSPLKKPRLTIHRIVNNNVYDENEDGENCKSLSNRSDNSSSSHKPSKQDNCGEKGAIKSSKENICEGRPKEPNQTVSKSNPASSSATGNLVKRIPRRFIDDPSLPVLKSGMRLASPDDCDELNSLHCFVRADLLEVFVLEDSRSCQPCKDGKQIHRVGIRCVYCGTKPKSERAGTSMSTFFPKSLEDIYRGVCTWQRIHFPACKHMPDEMKYLYKALKDGDRSRGKKAHWIRSARKMGFQNVDENRNGVVWVDSAKRTSKAEPQCPKVTLDLTILDDENKADSGSSTDEDKIVPI